MNVNEAMTSSVVSCRRETSLQDIAGMMWAHDCGAIPVVNESEHPIGIVTDRDIAMAAMLNRHPLWELDAGQVIQGQRLSCSHQEDSIESCLEKMEQNGVRRVVVTNQDGTLAGIISMGDIIAFTGKSEPKSRRDAAPIEADEVLGMLKHVSGHHPSQPHPPMAR